MKSALKCSWNPACMKAMIPVFWQSCNRGKSICEPFSKIWSVCLLFTLERSSWGNCPARMILMAIVCWKSVKFAAPRDYWMYSYPFWRCLISSLSFFSSAARPLPLVEHGRWLYRGVVSPVSRTFKINFLMMRLPTFHHGCPRFCVARAIQTKNIDEEAQTDANTK